MAHGPVASVTGVDPEPLTEPLSFSLSLSLYFYSIFVVYAMILLAKNPKELRTKYKVEILMNLSSSGSSSDQVKPCVLLGHRGLLCLFSWISEDFNFF